MNKPTPLLGQLFKKLAPKIGAKVIEEPHWHIVGQIIFKNGRKSYYRYSSLDLNTLGASEISKDKDYANFFMRKLGYPTVPGKAFYSKDWSKAIGSKNDVNAAFKFATRLGFPVIVKPNSGSQGSNVSKVYNKKEFHSAMNRIFKHDRVALVQKFLTGNDYRIVVLDGNVISAYHRLPLSIMGDGKATIKQLLEKKQKQFIRDGRDTLIRMNDVRILQNLKRQRHSLRTVLTKGEKLMLLDNANLSSGGDAIDKTRVIHSGFEKLAIRLTKDMGLRMCGVDLMIQGRIEDKPSKFSVLETNAAPGLDHYVKTGKRQQKLVEQMYLKVLKALERDR